jgi:C4-dicarboxylate transporter DctM subunit
MDLIVIFIVVFLGLAVLKVPIPFSAAGAGLVGLVAVNASFNFIPTKIFSSLDSFAFLAIPAFICAGDVMSYGGITRALVSFVRAVCGPIKGSVGATTVIASALFGTISGSSVATVSAIGTMMLPEMLRAGYKRDYAISLIAASGFLGILIPPSIPGLVYALSANLSIADVWISTLGPGVLLTLVYVVYNRIFFGAQEQAEVHEGKDNTYLKVIYRRFPRGSVAILMPIIIFASIYGGVLTPTEAGALAVAYGLVAGWIVFPLVFKEKPGDSFFNVVRKTAIASSTICLLIAFAAIPSAMFVHGNTIKYVTDFLLGVTESPAIFLLLVNMALIVVGMFMETNTSILLLTPILVPAAKAYGIDPIHFGAVLLLNLEIGMITPPFAVNVFVACKLGGSTMDKILKHNILFCMLCMPVLAATTYLPSISMYFVNLFK